MEWLIYLMLFVTIIALSGILLGYVEGRRKHQLEMQREERLLIEAHQGDRGEEPAGRTRVPIRAGRAGTLRPPRRRRQTVARGPRSTRDSRGVVTANQPGGSRG